MKITTSADKSAKLCTPVSALYEAYSSDQRQLWFSNGVNNPV